MFETRYLALEKLLAVGGSLVEAHQAKRFRTMEPFGLSKTETSRIAGLLLLGRFEVLRFELTASPAVPEGSFSANRARVSERRVAAKVAARFQNHRAFPFPPAYPSPDIVQARGCQIRHKSFAFKTFTRGVQSRETSFTPPAAEFADGKVDGPYALDFASLQRILSSIES
jgi:hypothetical protein